MGGSDLKRGYVVELHGTFEEGFGTFVGSMNRARVVAAVDPVPGDSARKFRDWFADAVRRAIPEPQASLGIGYLVGQKSALPPDLLEALQVAGLTHIVVASGYNLSILVRLSRRLLSKMSKFTAFAGSIALVLAMIAITGISPSMSRAGIVTGLSLLTWYYGRGFHPLVLLPFAAAITVMIEPSYAWGDLGWLLSFTAFIGVMILAPLIQRFFFGNKDPGLLRQVLGETVAAHVLTAPIVIMSFSTLSHVAIFANLMIVPLVPIAMLLTFLSGVGTLFFPWVDTIIGTPATLVLQYMVAIAYWWSELPWARAEVVFEWWMTVVAYVCIIFLCIVLQRLTKLSLRNNNIVE